MEESRFTKEAVVCPVCLNEELATVWTTINAESDPDLKEQLLRKQIHEQICSNCGTGYYLDRPLLYADPAARLMVYGPVGAGAADRSRQTGALPAPAGWTLRLAADYNQLIEKIHLQDHDCHDGVMELVKLAVRRQGCAGPDPDGADAGAGQAIRTLYFLTADERTLCFMAADEAGRWYTLELDRDVYWNTERLLAGMPAVPTGSWQVVDADYAAALLRQLAESDAAMP